jgi:Ca-activated chloride channel homolog
MVKISQGSDFFPTRIRFGVSNHKSHPMKKLLFLTLTAVVWGCDYPVDRNSPVLSGVPFEFDANEFNEIEENPFVNVADNPVSTFSIDADGASYGIARRLLNSNRAIPTEALRTEEFINYFPLDYADENGSHPISLNGEVSGCPWNPAHKLIRIGMKGKSLPSDELPPSNIVLLIDVSGSMEGSDRLGLLQKGFSMLVDNFSSSDRIAIVTYAGVAGVALQSTPGNQKTKINEALAGLRSGGSTAGSKGIITAYEIAKKNFILGGNNRVILGTDGDFNVGISSKTELVSLIEQKREEGIFLTVVGVGYGNLNDAMMEQVADHGNGTYEYLDNEKQAKKIFVDEYYKFYPAAKDVKVQVSFNDQLVEAYRLIGYENRLLQNSDFEDDKKDAGEISIGQNITALYEIIPRENSAFRTIPTFTIDFRYKKPAEDVSIPLTLEILDGGNSFADASENMRFTTSVAGFGLLLRNSSYKGTLTFDEVINWATEARTYDPFGHRSEFIELVKKAKGE